jgi:hypothetical protein
LKTILKRGDAGHAGYYDKQCRKAKMIKAEQNIFNHKNQRDLRQIDDLFCRKRKKSAVFL